MPAGTEMLPLIVGRQAAEPVADANALAVVDEVDVIDPDTTEERADK